MGISGVLHPSESTYELVHGRSPWLDGHSLYEGVLVFEWALQSWPEVRIVLTSTQPWAKGLDKVLRHLGPTLASRVVGFTYEDLTTRIKREVPTRSGTTRIVGYSNEDYWRMSTADIVAAHVAWSHPEQWAVIDDEDILWPADVRRDRLVLTDGCVGLRSARTRDRLCTVMEQNFGPATPSATRRNYSDL
jgi:HAD domain in Swiss Army Knife RNA repair proteins